MHFIGRKQLHEGPAWAAGGGIGALFLKTDVLDFYACPDCRSIELFLPPGSQIGTDAAPPELEPGQQTWKCECGEVNIRSEEYCRKCGAPRHAIS